MKTTFFFPLIILLSIASCHVNPWTEFEESSSIITFEKKFSKGRAIEVIELPDGRIILNNGLLATGLPKLLILNPYGEVVDTFFQPDFYQSYERMLLVDDKIVLCGRVRQYAPFDLNFDKALITSYNLDLKLNQSEVIDDNIKFHHLKKINGIATDLTGAIYFLGEYSNDIYYTKSTFFGSTSLNTPLALISDSVRNVLPDTNSLFSAKDGVIACVAGGYLHILSPVIGINIQNKESLGDFFLIGGPVIHSSGKILMSGLNGNNESVIQIRNLQGELEKEIAFTDVVFTSMAETQDGGLVAAGVTPGALSGKDIYLQKFNSEFEADTSAHQVYPYESDELPFCIIQSKDKGYLIGGSQVLGGDEWMFLLKTDSLGIVK